MDEGLKNKFDSLYAKFGEETMAELLEVDVRTIKNYVKGDNPNKGIIQKISESFEDYIIFGGTYVPKTQKPDEVSGLREIVRLQGEIIKLQDKIAKIQESNSNAVLEKLSDNRAVLDNLTDLLQAHFGKPKVAYTEKSMDQKKGKNADSDT
jgi:hypothetical protein